MNSSDFKYYLRNTKGVSKIYGRFVNAVKGDKFRIENIPNITPVLNKNNKLRLSIVLPTFDSDFVYGGISTALKILDELSKELCAEKRIIVLQGKYSAKSTYKINGYSCEGKDPNLVFLENTQHKISVGRLDFFIGTFWTTIYGINAVLSWQKKNFDLPYYKFIYLIQDYEPGFYNWSTRYLMADNTYKIHSDRIIALYNAESLKTFFKNRNYSFANEFCFNPTINQTLGKYIVSEKLLKKREKIILIYGRPRIDRNLFEVLRYSLSMWSKKYPDAKNWRIYSLGAEHEDIKLKSNTIICKGKLSLDEYAQMMLRSYAGISLMLSPHPSYPPLEFSTFGLRTITNTYENKDLKDFNSNIISINACSPNEIANQLMEICDEYETHSTSWGINEEYMSGNSFSEAISEISKELQKIINRKCDKV